MTWRRAAMIVLWGYTIGLALTHVVLQLAALLGVALMFLRRRRGAADSSNASWLAIGPLAWMSAISGLLAGIMVGDSSLLPELLPHAVLVGALPFAAPGSRLMTPSSRRAWVVGLVLLGAAAAVAGTIDHLRGAERAAGFYGGYFTLASTMVYVLPAALALALSSAHRSRAAWLLVAALLLAALWWTYTRSAFLAVGVGLGVWAVVELTMGARAGARRTARSAIVRAATIVVAPCLLVALVLSSPNSRLNPIVNELRPDELTEDLSSGRRGIVDDALRLTRGAFADRELRTLVFGHGLSSRQRLIGGHFTSWESDALQAFMNQGLLGLACIAALFVSLGVRIARALWSGDELARGVAASALGLTIMSVFTLQILSSGGAAMFGLTWSYLDRCSSHAQPSGVNSRQTTP